MKEILIASSNEHKINEFKRMLKPLGYQVKSLLDFSEVLEIEEIGTTFAENAAIKAEFLSKYFNTIAIADDSGLVIDALNGEPGIYSARYLGHDTSYTFKNNEILKRMKGITERNCRFVCAIAYAQPNQNTKIFEDTIEGEVAHSIEGSHGFGYDPIFYYPPLQTSLASLDEDHKNMISHRGKALVKFLTYLQGKENE